MDANNDAELDWKQNAEEAISKHAYHRNTFFQIEPFLSLLGSQTRFCISVPRAGN
jgi:hypothetical protein